MMKKVLSLLLELRELHMTEMVYHPMNQEIDNLIKELQEIKSV